MPGGGEMTLSAPGGDRVELQRRGREVALDELVVVAEGGEPGISSPWAANGRRAASSSPGIVGKPKVALGDVVGLPGGRLRPGASSACRSRSGRRPATPSNRVRSPESGRTVLPPSRTSMFQRISLSWLLSELSPVCSVKASGRPVTGPTPISLIARTIASATWAVSISCGRYADAEEADRRVALLVGVVVAVDPLHPRRALHVDDVHVGDLGEGQDAPCGAAAPGLHGRDPEVVADQVRLSCRPYDRARSRPRPARPRTQRRAERGQVGGRTGPTRGARAGSGRGGQRPAPAPPATSPALIRARLEMLHDASTTRRGVQVMPAVTCQALGEEGQQVLAGDHADRLAVLLHEQGVGRPTAPATACSTGSVEPTVGSGGLMCASTGSLSRACPGEQRVHQRLGRHRAGHLGRHDGRLGPDDRHLRDAVLLEDLHRLARSSPAGGCARGRAAGRSCRAAPRRRSARARPAGSRSAPATRR